MHGWGKDTLETRKNRFQALDFRHELRVTEKQHSPGERGADCTGWDLRPRGVGGSRAVWLGVLWTLGRTSVLF